MTRVIAVAVAALLVVAAPGRLMAQCSESDKAALVAFDKAWTTATRAGDRTQLESILSAGFAAHGNTGTTDKATTIANAVRNAAARTARGGHQRSLPGQLRGKHRDDHASERDATGRRKH